MDVLSRAARGGILTEYFDVQGGKHTTDPDILQTILDAIPQRSEGTFLVEPVVVVQGQPCSTQFADASVAPLAWRVSDGEKELASGKSNSKTIVWPVDLPIGIFSLHITDAKAVIDHTVFIVAPAKAFRGTFDRAWILAVQLYGVRSSRNWGIGDFSDLETLIGIAAELGAAGIGLNPLHLLFDDRPADCSPYSPSSRIFLNPLYIDVAKIPGFTSDCQIDNAQEIARIRQSDLVDYPAVAELKWRAFRSAFENFRVQPSGPGIDAFQMYREHEGSKLSRYACFEVLRHKFRRPWWDWPKKWRTPENAPFAELRAGPAAVEIEFIEFVQWCAHAQLTACQTLARARGMRVGLYLDIAVGVQGDGFDAWDEQLAISRQLSVGAPPDLLNTEGQNWGLAGFNAVGLEIKSFAPFAGMLHAAMRYAGAVRLDHVLGLNRLYLIPHGFKNSDGVYVKMPLDALLGVVAQQSIAHRCIVIGEDLGTVPEGFRDHLAQWGVWSYRVMMFERDHVGAFIDPDRYSADALVTFNTHDLATFSGWSNSHDIKIKRSLGIDPGEHHEDRQYSIGQFGEALRRQAIDHQSFYSASRFLASSKSRLLAVSLEDLLEVFDQPNIPGTVNEHPNWRRRLPDALEDFLHRINRSALRWALEERSEFNSG